MSMRDKFLEYSFISTDWRRILIRGIVLLGCGILISILTLFKPDVMVFHARDTSWLPISALLLLVLGLLECFDAIIAKELKDLILNIQIGLLDVVIALLIIFNASNANALSLLVAAFLIIKGSFRIILSYAMNRSNSFSTRVGAAISILLGFLITIQFPSSAGWFLAFCMSVEIALRGWAVLVTALWLQAQQE